MPAEGGCRGSDNHHSSEGPVRYRPRRPPCRGRPDARRAGSAGAQPARPVRAVGQPRGQPARLHRRGLRAAAGRCGHSGTLAGRCADRDHRGDAVRHAGGSAGRAARRADWRACHGAAARAVRCQDVLPADRREHRAVRGLGRVRAGDDRRGRPHGGSRPAEDRLCAHRRDSHGAAHDQAARRYQGAAEVRNRRRTGRAVLPVRAAHPPAAAGLHAWLLVRVLGGDRHRGRGRRIVGPARRRLHQALPQSAGCLRRRPGRLQRHSGAVLRHRADRPGHRGAQQPGPDLRRVHCPAARCAWLRGPGRTRARPGVRQRVLHRRVRRRTCARSGTGGSWPAPSRR